MPTVFLIDPMTCLGKPELYSAISGKLQVYFDLIGQAMRPADKIVVTWTKAVPALTPQDLFVYFTPLEYSVVSRFAGKPFDPQAVTHWGYTYMKRGPNGSITEAASEVYPKSLDAESLAMLAMHESMHNKLGLGNEMHSRNGMAQPTVGPGTKFTPQNVNDLAAVMRNPRPQWTGGVALMVAAKRQQELGDPLWNL